MINGIDILVQHFSARGRQQLLLLISETSGFKIRSSAYLVQQESINLKFLSMNFVCVSVIRMLMQIIEVDMLL